MGATKKVSSKTQINEIEKFYLWMERINSVHISNFQGMDRAFIAISENNNRKKK